MAFQFCAKARGAILRHQAFEPAKSVRQIAHGQALFESEALKAHARQTGVTDREPVAAFLGVFGFSGHDSSMPPNRLPRSDCRTFFPSL